MLYDPLNQVIVSITTGAIAFGISRRRASTVITKTAAGYYTLAIIQVMLVAAVEFAYFVQSPIFSVIRRFIASPVLIFLNLPVIILFGGDEIIEQHGSMVPTVTYHLAFLLYSFVVAFAESRRRAT